VNEAAAGLALVRGGAHSVGAARRVEGLTVVEAECGKLTSKPRQRRAKSCRVSRPNSLKGKLELASLGNGGPASAWVMKGMAICFCGL